MTDIAGILSSMEYGPAPEDQSLAVQWLESHDRQFGHFIDGKFIFAKDSETFDCINPATDERLATVSHGTKETVEFAYQAARSAAPNWAAMSGHHRARILYALARQVQKHSRLVAVLESMNNGKTIRESRDIDIPLVARHFYHHAGWAELCETKFAGRSPVGICGLVIPWNFPLLMLAWKVAPALAAGCTMVLKPAEYTPLTAMLFAEICKSAGLPDGVLNIVNGDGRTGEAIVAHDGLSKIAFTGSTEVGRKIRKTTAGSGKKISLELGGKSPFIVYATADLDSAVEGVVDAIWFNQGEVCCAGSRALVQEAVAETFISKLKMRMEKLRIGDPLDKGMDIGAVVHPVQVESIKSRVSEAMSDGASIWQPELQMPEKGSFYPPTLLLNVEPSSPAMQEEIFGPVLTVTTFRTPDEAVALANNSKYGLAASIWSQDIDTAFETAKNVNAGVVWINSTNQFDASAGFGGYRQSGFGREGGMEGMEEYFKPLFSQAKKGRKTGSSKVGAGPAKSALVDDIDRTIKLYIGGKQARPDSGYSFIVSDKKERPYAEVGLGNRKDIRNAVEAAEAAKTWSGMTGHQRAQVLYFLAENLELRADEFTSQLQTLCGYSAKAANAEFDASISRIFHYGAWADKFDGSVRAPQSDMLTVALREPWGVVGVCCPSEQPLLSMISLAMPTLAMGNRIVLVPDQQSSPILGNFYQVLETSDVPAGVFNIITGVGNELAKTLAQHDGINAVWYFGTGEGIEMVERESAGNMKFTWVEDGSNRDWHDVSTAQGEGFLFRASQIKTIWTPFGV